ncbi:MAG: hypothetical protein ACKVOQ_10090 [Cyclobacteriaceae bacterium]
MRKTKFIWLFMFMSYVMGSCTCGSPQPKFYTAFIYYKNTKGEDLLDTKIQGHFSIDSIKLNGYHSDIANFSIVNTSNLADPNLPNGLGLSIVLSTSVNRQVISLNKALSDTLYYSFSNATLVTCRYNRAMVSPPTSLTNFPYQFPVVVIK